MKHVLLVLGASINGWQPFNGNLRMLHFVGWHVSGRSCYADMADTQLPLVLQLNVLCTCALVCT